MSTKGDESQKDLDAEFRQILYMIKPYIGEIDDHYRIERYRIWLEKLSTTSAAEKLERNRYLLELANQIHDNALKAPFTFNPPRGPLPRLKQFLRDDFSEIDWPYLSPRRSANTNQSFIIRKYSQKDQSPVTKTRSLQLKRPTSPFKKIGKCREVSPPRNSETSSWCDLSETVASEDGDDEDVEVKDVKMYKSDDERSCRSTAEEIEALRMRMKDLVEVKRALKDTQCLTEERKKTIDKLQNRVVVLEMENAELKSTIDLQKKKFSEMEILKAKEVKDFKEKFSSLRQKEVDMMKQQCQREIRNLKQIHEEKEKQLQSKLESLQNEYESVYAELRLKEKFLDEKDKEICRLQEDLKSQGDASNEQYNEQIVNLKKCLSKLDRLLHKNEKDYVRKIEKLKQELEVRDMTTQVQLQTQRADLIVRTSASKQEELKSALNSLEGKYKKMMENLQEHALESKKHDEKLIKELQTIVNNKNKN